VLSLPRNLVPEMSGDLFAEHFGDDEDQNGATESTAKEEVEERVTGGCEFHNLRNHVYLL
jgi:hypothetical protein